MTSEGQLPCEFMCVWLTGRIGGLTYAKSHYIPLRLNV